MYVHIDRKEPDASAHDLVMSNIMYVFALASIKNDAP